MTNYVPCPKCQGSAEKLNFTWWGGLVGPKLLSHVKCSSCGHTYNGKNGKDNKTAIIVYCIVVGVLAFALLFVVFAFVIGVMLTSR